MRRLLTTPVEALFRVLFTYDCLGEEHVPATGPAVVAANHPSYLDPVLLSLQLHRPIRFMAWDAIFRVPLLGRAARAFGAFPVDTRRGRGGEAYLRAKALVLEGEVVGVFPEGRRSQTGWMEPTLREGAARLAWETGAPLVPATIAGAFRAWPHFRSLPRPARIRVRFHPPLDPAPYRSQPEDVAVGALLAELRRRVDQSLLPGVKADRRFHLLYAQRPPWPRPHEVLLAVTAATFPLLHGLSAASAAAGAAYLGYLLLDRLVLPQSREVKWLRNASPLVFVLAAGPTVLGALALPRPPAGTALAAVLAGALFPYLYERGRPALGFLRGLSAASLLETGVLLLVPDPLGPHVALPLFAAAYAWARRSVFWRWTAPVLAFYAAGVPVLLGAALPPLVPHALAGLLAAATTLLLAPRGGLGSAPARGLGLALSPRPGERA